MCTRHQHQIDVGGRAAPPCAPRRGTHATVVSLGGLLLWLSMPVVAQGPVKAQRMAVEHAEFSFLPTSTGRLVAAPHGSIDLHTGAIAPLVAGHLGAGYVVARAQGGGGKTRINVNRPTEGAHLACAAEQPSTRSEAVYQSYVQVVDKAAGMTSPRLYVEIHGNSDGPTASRIEVAAKGITAREAGRAKDAYGKLLEDARRRSANFPALELYIQPLDGVHFDAACLKTRGIGAEKTPRLLHFELPNSAREPEMHETTARLIAGLVKAVESSR
jgi:hypothetical protein